MDQVFIEHLSLRGKHGVNERERSVEQEFLVDIVVDIDTASAQESDAIEDTVNYSSFREIAKEMVERNSFFLIEKLAGSIADAVLADERIKRVSVTVRKPAAYPDTVPGVTIVRTRA